MNFLLEHQMKLVSTSPSPESLLKTKSIKTLPGPKQLPVLGNFFELWKLGGILHLPSALKKWRSEFGDTFLCGLGPIQMVCLANPEKIEDLFRKEGKYPRRDKATPAWIEYHKERGLSEGFFLL